MIQKRLCSISVKIVYGKIEGLPESKVENMEYQQEIAIVIAQVINDRPDVYVPDTNPASVVRDSEDKIIGAKRLMRL